MTTGYNDILSKLTALSALSVSDVLAVLATEYRESVVFSTSFSQEDQVITDFICTPKLPIGIFTLDTGRLFEETYYVWSRTNELYNTQIKVYYPDRHSLELFLNDKGPNSFYDSIDNRKTCCAIRKVEPLRRALHGNAVWITGLRAEHSPDRGSLPMFEWDESNSIIKYHPLLHWSTEDVREYIHKKGIPYNTLHDKGFVSIGCAPCTRAVHPGEDFRAGRWWWENKETKECGLHSHS